MDFSDWDMTDASSLDGDSTASLASEPPGTPAKRQRSDVSLLSIEKTDFGPPAKTVQTTLPYAVRKPVPARSPQPSAKKLTQTTLNFETTVNSFFLNAKAFLKDVSVVLATVEEFEAGALTSKTELAELLEAHATWIEFFVRLDGIPEMATFFRDLAAADAPQLAHRLVFTRIPLARVKALVLLYGDEPWKTDTVRAFRTAVDAVSPHKGAPICSPEVWFKRGVILLRHSMISKGRQLMKGKWTIFWNLVQEYLREFYPTVALIHIGSKKKTCTGSVVHLPSLEEGVLLKALTVDLHTCLLAK